MFSGIKLILLCVAILMLQVKCADKYTDENRPYEFGFSIAGEQHRHEKKDENGIIMGEFGFITADGVYHVTVYATDENGGFKILSMKNIRVKPYPTAKAGPEKGRSLEFSPSNPAVPEKTDKEDQKLLKPGPASPAKSCSHCSIPTTTTTTTTTETPYIPYNNAQQISLNPDVLPKEEYPENYPQQGANQAISQEQLQNTSDQIENVPNYPQHKSVSQQNYPQTVENSERNYPQTVENSERNYPQSGGLNYGQNYETNSADNAGGNNPISEVNRQPKSYEEEYPQQQITKGHPNGVEVPPSSLGSPHESSVSKKPQLISAQMQIVDKNTDIYYKRPGEKDGLPKGLTTDDMSQLLYTFNYTVGFHGHYEEGYTNGAKQGYYFVTGRNGVKTRIDYIADEHGFQPKITQEVLDLLSDEVPKAETEKDPKYGLKGYEFKWLYYPEDTKRR
ncbi:uncharacterized protein l(3)mbn [Battus philenor]|uniref:uncharacterized protein l(3)mbn n=1 Tax=Battus philenor TaxID=42288 RepID=UPI0035D05A94